MALTITRRTLLGTAAASLLHMPSRTAWGSAGVTSMPATPPVRLSVISGTPRERGRSYGRRFNQEIHDFLEREIYRRFGIDGRRREKLLHYAEACANEVRRYSAEIAEELEGVAEATGLKLPELLLITLHEELYHGGEIPKFDHCTALSVGPPDTSDGCSYVGQTWDWMPSVFGKSTLLYWQRKAAPGVLAYSYPGLWAGAGVNSAGVALCWTSGSGLGISAARVGIPSYLLIAQMLYQESLDAAIQEARRAKQAGWFTFVLGDGKGRRANVEATPDELCVEVTRDPMVRVDYGSRQLTRTPASQTVKYHPRCQKLYAMLEAQRGRLDGAVLKQLLSDPAHGFFFPQSTVDAFLFNTTRRSIEITRGLGSAVHWQRFGIPMN